MKSLKQPINTTISFVIPVYNEQDGIALCLDSIAAQTIKPHQVIVVDNNCQDDTAKIAGKYPFVTIVKEKKQGMIAARNAGFKHVTGDVIARIDGDTLLPSDWVQTVVETFAKNLNNVGCTGPLYFRDLPCKRLLTVLHFIIYFVLGRLLFGRQIFFGSNMAFKAKFLPLLLERSKDDQSKVHEDIDLALCLSTEGKISFVWRQKIGVSFYKAAGSVSKVTKRLPGFFFIWRYTFFR